MLRIAIFVFVAYAVIALVNQQIQISQKRQELSEINQQIQVQELKNDEMQHTLDAGEEESNEYAEQVAREKLGYAKPGERIFVNVGGH